MKPHHAVLMVLWLLFSGANTSALVQDEPAAESGEVSGQSQADRLAAARRAKAENLTPAEVSSGEARVRSLEEARFPQNIFVKGFRGFRPVFGGMPSGSGLVFGGGYVRGLESEIFTASADARFSTRGFKQADIRLLLPTAQSGRPIRAFVNASYQE